MKERTKDRATMLLLITTMLTVLASGVLAQSNEYSYFNDLVTAANLRQKNDGRLSKPYQYDLNMVVKLGSSLTLTTLNNSNPIYWILTRYTNETFYMQQNNQQVNEKLTKLPLFKLAQPDIRTESIRNTFLCLPKEETCNMMSVQKFNISLIGMYTYQSLINSFESLYVYYNISTFIAPVSVNCHQNQSSSCRFNESNNALSVLQGTSVTFTCSVYIAQNDIYDPAVEMIISPENDPSECGDSPAVVEIVPPAQAYRISRFGNENINLVMYQVRRNCTRTFSKTQSNVNYQCRLMPKVNPDVPIEIQPNPKIAYDVLNFRLDVQYPPVFTPPPLHQVNRTISANTSAVISFICPYDSSPAPQFEWRVASVNITSPDGGGISPKKRRLDTTQFLTSTKEYVVPRDLDTGFYLFECRARTLGLIDKYSDTMQFNLNVIPSTVTAKKDSKTNLGAIIGGTIGGVIALVLIVLVVLFLVRRHKNGSKDEIEKAKEVNKKPQQNKYSSPEAGPAGGGAKTGSGYSESSQLVNSKQQPSHGDATNNDTSTLSNQLPILELRKAETGSQNNVTLSSTSMSNRTAVAESTGFKKIDDITNSAHEFIFNPNVGQQHQPPVHPPPTLPKPRSNVPADLNASASNYEARRYDAAAADSNPTSSRTFKPSPQTQTQTQPPSLNLGTVPGGVKVLPTSSSPLTLINQNPLESPPPYDAALHQPIKKDSPLQQQRILMQQQQQQKDFMGSNTRLLSGSNTPTLQPKHSAVPTSHSYTAAAPLSNLLAAPPNGSNSLQQMTQYQQQMTAPGSLQYTTVQNLARNRNPLNGLPPQHQSDIDNTNAAMSQLNPIDV